MTSTSEQLQAQQQYKNGYQEALGKRIRTLRKRLTKIEKYEELPRDQLNEDQLQALDKKPILAFAMKELDELAKQFSIVDQEVN
jgi:hypothetical protein